MDIKVIHRHQNGSTTNFGLHEFSEMPNVDDRIKLNTEKVFRVRTTTTPVNGNAPTIVVEDI